MPELSAQPATAHRSLVPNKPLRTTQVDPNKKTSCLALVPSLVPRHRRWLRLTGGQTMDDLPPREETGPDANGIKTVTAYRFDDVGNKIKTTQTVKVTKKTVKMHKKVQERRHWAKFGEEASKPAGYHGRGYQDPGTVTIDVNEQTLDMTPKLVAVEESNESAQRAFEKMNAGTFEAWRPKQRDLSSAAKEWAEQNGLKPMDASAFGGGPDGPSGGMPRLGGGKDSYIPPSQRGLNGERLQSALPERDDSCKVRVSNLSEDVKDSDLRDLFRRFGNIQRVYLAKDRETHQSRGFAFVNFYERESAAAAIAALDGHGYDHLILSVSWADPNAAPPASAPNLGPGAFPALGGGSRPPPNMSDTGAVDKYDRYIHDRSMDRY